MEKEHEDASCFYYQSGRTQNKILLKEIIEGFETDKPIFGPEMWFRCAQNPYWSTLEFSKELGLALHWDYIKENEKYTYVKGVDLVNLFYRGIIDEKTQIKLSYGFAWRKFRDTILGFAPQYEFSGIVAHKPDWKNWAARIIDVFATLLIILFILMNIYSLLILLILILIIPSFFEASCVYALGGTIGHRAVGLYILNSNGTKLKFGQAFKRQWDSIEPRRRYSRRAFKLHPVGATRWDRNKGYVVTKQRPFNS